MRRSIFVVATILLMSLSASAQDLRRGFSVFLSDPNIESSHPGGSGFEGGFGAAFDYAVSRRFSAAVSIAAESHYASSFTGDLVYRRVTVHSYPIDAIGSY